MPAQDKHILQKPQKNIPGTSGRPVKRSQGTAALVWAEIKLFVRSSSERTQKHKFVVNTITQKKAIPLV